MSRCNFPTISFPFALPSFVFKLPSLPIFTLAIPFPPPCPLD